MFNCLDIYQIILRGTIISFQEIPKTKTRSSFMETTDSENTREPVINTTLKITIKDFSSAVKKHSFRRLKHRHCNLDFKLTFIASAYPNGYDKKTEGWLVVCPDVRINAHRLYYLDDGFLSCTISVVDIEGNSRFPRSFEKFPSEKDEKCVKYLEKSFILNRADEFLVEGKLTILCDFCLHLGTVNTSPTVIETRMVLEEFLRTIPQAQCSRRKIQMGDLYINSADRSDTCTVFNLQHYIRSLPQFHESRHRFTAYNTPSLSTMYDPTSTEDSADRSDICTVFDLTHYILTLPQFHELRKRYGVYGIPSASTSQSSTPIEDIASILEHVWIFDTRDDRFLLSLDERQDSVGVQLLKASPVIRRCVDFPMKEHQEKCIKFPTTDSRVFSLVLYFLEKGKFLTSDYRVFLEIYRFFHLYEMKELQQKCAEEMVKTLKYSTDIEEVQESADLCSDDYLSELLESRRKNCEHSLVLQKRLKEDDRPDRLDSNCYI